MFVSYVLFTRRRGSGKAEGFGARGRLSPFFIKN